MYAIASKVPIKGITIKNMLKLFDTCISPILLYGSEVWGPYLNINWTNWESTPIEKLHTQYISQDRLEKWINLYMSPEDDKITEPVVTLINNMLETRENCYMDNKLDIV